jgi:hypothetical protein
VQVGGDRPLVHIADTLHHHAHIEHPEWDGPPTTTGLWPSRPDAGG